MSDIVNLLTLTGSTSLSPPIVYLAFAMWRLSTKVAEIEKNLREIHGKIETVEHEQTRQNIRNLRRFPGAQAD